MDAGTATLIVCLLRWEIAELDAFRGSVPEFGRAESHSEEKEKP
jgi:hypothetical protein